MFAQQSSLMKQKYFFTYAFQLVATSEMQEALRSATICGEEGVKNSSQYMKQDWAELTI